VAEKSGRPVLTGDWPRRSGRGENHLHFAVTAAVESSEQPLPSGWSDADYIVTLLTTSSRCTAAKNAGVDWTVDRWCMPQVGQSKRIKDQHLSHFVRGKRLSQGNLVSKSEQSIKTKAPNPWQYAHYGSWRSPTVG